MRIALVLLGLIGGCGGAPSMFDQGTDGTADMGRAFAAADLAPTVSDMPAALADLAHGDMAELASMPDLAHAPPVDMTPACGLIPSCTGDVSYPNGTLCCNAAACISGSCFSTSGMPCNNETGPLCYNSKLGQQINNGVCGTDGKCQ